MAVKNDRSLAARIEGTGYDLYANFFRLFPVETASALGAAVARMLGPLAPVHQVAKRNIEICFPGITPEREAEILTGMWDNLGRMLGEFPHIGGFRAYTDDPRLIVTNPERLDQLYAAGKGVVFISGHFANFELLAPVIVQRGVPCQVTYRAINNYWVDKRITEARTAYGATDLAAKGRTGGMSLLRALKMGETVALMNDQKNNQGVLAPFFGSAVMTHDGPVRLAKRFAAPLVPISIERLPKARFRLTVHDPIAIPDGPDDETAVRIGVARVNKWIEDRIREKPEDWFWVHRRWPKEVYRGVEPADASAAEVETSKLKSAAGST